ncbi:PREDICTED: ABC transporter G family member 28-like [Ipomoea nil]|uniref:ABC transporter G family member 28-like n=1 Tax=Ipomoea nil TaxID=35883 RepID=UPI000901B760|nr:PREDICTED: ABC transporter G family member 28-like [Ipomoea nil]
MHRQKDGNLCHRNNNAVLLSFICVSVFLLAPPATRRSYAAVDVNNPEEVRLLTHNVSNQLKNFTALFGNKVAEELGFCIYDVEAEWKRAFDFSDKEFLSNCVKRTKGDMMQRLCTASEIQFYAANIMMGALARKSTNFVTLNKNCNLSSWGAGCDPGWACGVGKNVSVDLKNIKEIPARTDDCQPCCEGFFCPHGLTCMLPCPLGSYCPVAKLNEATAGCDPYNYQVQPSNSNQTCGGADMWADIITGNDLFCPAGSYCPSTIRKFPCDSGHYCRTGSTTQSKCYRLATCDPQTENQNITAYGALFVAGIMLILLVIYSCSDRVLSTREKRQAKSREAAVKTVRETVQAQTWKATKDIAKKHATGLQTQLSRTFSRKKSVREETNSIGQASPVMDVSFLSSPSEENSESYDDFNDIEIENKNLKKKPTKTKHMHTRSEMFRYAYGEIEKEKARQENSPNLSYSGVISLASDTKVITRPPIEVVFKDLTLSLTGKKKHLLRCVSGKLSPGRVSAVMGPSGAGKTTFLSALTGKATACTMSGVILINGKAETVQSYKKIIGFVPQDDIVHGNLTVEENLWFSAICRLPAKLVKAEKVLVVERVIESLGLQNVRDSLVGTVEKRGISGGQRKRVNVGLEMVMEPSLLILDEPTSGLDSSSSQLLLKALRREALEGVNICMVLHQPSYTLFNMFDDFILLAKGGLVVYHGPVKKVEEYFAGLGIHVPERVNPPDFFIDILEGIEKLSPDIGFNYKDLPLKWMLHNGYTVPPDMLSPVGLAAANGESPGHESNPASEEPDGPLFANLWEDLKSNVEQKRDQVKHYFLTLKDSSNRNTPGLLVQYKYFLGRIGKQRLREARVQAVDYLILLLAGICLGTLAKVSDESFGSMGYLYTVIAVSLLSKIAALRSFSLDKLHYWRESASGMSSLAYFMAKDTIDQLNIIIKPAVYLSMFYFFNNPRSSILDNYIVLFCLIYSATGIAYVLAICFEPGQAQLWSVLLPVVLTLVANQKSDSFLAGIGDFCYTKWTLEAFLIANARRYSGVWLITRCGVLKQRGFALLDWYSCLGCLILTGILSRIIAFFCLITFQSK